MQHTNNRENIFKALRFLPGIMAVHVLLCVSAISMTAEEFEKEAMRQGMSGTQIRELRRSYESTPGQPTAPKPFITQVSTEEINLDSLIEITTLQRADTTLQHFGYNLFSSTPDAFKPTAIGPIDPGYMTGPGDVLRLAVWGQSEFQYELTVNNDGKILIPLAGQVHVSGIPFEHLQSKIKNLLSRHYSGLSATPPRTFMDLSIARLRPIRIYIMGEVKQPGGYTVSSFANAFSALYSVGGPLEARGSMREIKVLRGDSIAATIDIYDYLLTGRSKTDIRLQNNDIVFVPIRGKTVHLSGAVTRPAIYELKKDEHFQDLLVFCGGVLSASNVNHAHLQRILPFTERSGARQMTQKIDIDLNRFIDNKEELILYDMDKIHIVPLFGDLRNIVTVSGAVQYPGIYQSGNMTLKGLIFDQARIIDNKTFSKRADLIRLNEDKVTTTIIPLNLETLQNGAGDMNMEPGDEVIIYDIAVARPTDPLITVEGEVRQPGVYLLHSNMTITDAILAAGGFTRAALKTGFDIYRLNLDDERKLIHILKSQLPDSVHFTEEALRKIELLDRDRIIVRRDPNYSEGRFVIVNGAVRYTGMFAMEEKTERFTTVIEKTGGFEPDAYLNGIYITRNGSRIIINTDAIYNDKKRGTREDIFLEHGDTITIPRRPNTITVSGQVNNDGIFGYVPNMRMRGYIERAGGFADSVDHVLIFDPNGEVKKVKKNSNTGINDGSSILVVKKQAKPQTARTGPSIADVIKDSLAIVASAVTILVLAAQIK
ncbi:MAG: SLBB domain-containing protein [Chitinispirillales bacterium]|jgi:protein involved in polysaccharide export with SLBB domain|nr:SLBB domain-containing protein [Chitinispirillales bacterium]